MRRLIKALEAQGFAVSRTGSGHFGVRKEGRWVATLSGSPSDKRAVLNAAAELRKAGFRAHAS